MLNVVLIEPLIPQNTGNIGRLCVCTGAKLHLVGPLGFEINEKSVRRAGLDYWKNLDYEYYENVAEFLANTAGATYYFFETFGEKRYNDAVYKPGDYLIFGKETTGIPRELIEIAPQNCVKLPQLKSTRSLNLSNVVAVGLYEALRQIGFEGV